MKTTRKSPPPGATEVVAADGSKRMDKCPVCGNWIENGTTIGITNDGRIVHGICAHAVKN